MRAAAAAALRQSSSSSSRGGTMIVRTYGRRSRSFSDTGGGGGGEGERGGGFSSSQDAFEFDGEDDDLVLLGSSSQAPAPSQESSSMWDFDEDPPQQPPPRRRRGRGGDYAEPATVAATSLMEAEEYGEMMESVDEVNFTLDGLRATAPRRVRRASFLALLGICASAPRRRVLWAQGCTASSIFRRRATALGSDLLVPHSRRAAFAMSATPPVARKVPRELAQHGDVRVDSYYWLRDDSRSHPDVLAHLRAENLYTATIMSDVKNLEDEIYAEIRARIKEDDIGVPLRKGQYYYYNRTLTGKEYVQHCRRLVPTDAPVTVYDVMPTGPNAPHEHIILDENVQAEGHDYYIHFKVYLPPLVCKTHYAFLLCMCLFNLSYSFLVSPNGKLVAYAQDTKGDEIYTVYVIDAESGKFFGQPLEGITSDIEWAGDDHLVYITMDAIHRPDKVWFHMLESNQSNDICLCHEKDDMFSLGLQTICLLNLEAKTQALYSTWIYQNKARSLWF